MKSRHGLYADVKPEIGDWAADFLALGLCVLSRLSHDGIWVQGKESVGSVR